MFVCLCVYVCVFVCVCVCFVFVCVCTEYYLYMYISVYHIVHDVIKMSPWIQALPPMLGGLTKLTTFIADENLLTTLPEEVRWPLLLFPSNMCMMMSCTMVM